MIRLILIIPFLLALILFAASNQDSLQMWLLTYGWSSSVGIVALIVAAISFLLGAFSVWVVELAQRRRARKAEAQIRELNATLAQRDAELAQLRRDAVMVPPISEASHTSLPPQPL
ncbi:LapA family protein [Acetobacter sacchari]|uniref:LapA family protein n=1 Tax=Acetobacter sacchari TaxID=2661687 RepID=A0ABS3LYE9_9PROT|nr:LapA family protein [Acetobacter sacchari]MBO1360939.1 LapA family protein [Acetobacter sacchari]